MTSSWRTLLHKGQSVAQMARDLQASGWTVMQLDTWGYMHAAMPEDPGDLMLVMLEASGLGPSWVSPMDAAGLISAAEPYIERTREQRPGAQAIGVTNGWCEDSFQVTPDGPPGLTLVGDTDNLLHLLRERGLLLTPTSPQTTPRRSGTLPLGQGP